MQLLKSLSLDFGLAQALKNLKGNVWNVGDLTLCLSSSGQVTGLQRGPTTERWEYDSQGRIISRVFADGKMWSYTYLDKVQANVVKTTHAYITVELQCEWVT